MHFSKKIIFKNFFFLFTIIFFIISCSKPKSKLAIYGNLLESVMLNDTGVFRGFGLGDRFDSILKSEANKPIETDSDYLYYEYKIDSTTSFNITYNFDETGLNEIQSDIFIKNPDSTDVVFNHFKTFFDEHYGKSETHMGYNVWTVPSEKYGNVRINLSDESADFSIDKAPGKITLWIYPDKD